MTSTTRTRQADPLVRYGVSVEDPPNLHVEIERIGLSYRAKVSPLGAELLFRDIRQDREPAAEVAISIRRRHLFRTTSTLSLTGRDRLAKTAFRMSQAGDAQTWEFAVHAAVEKVMEAEESLSGASDLRYADPTGVGSFWIAGRFWVNGPTVLVMPGKGGKSSMARAIAVSMASGRMVIPGIEPKVFGPVLYVAAEAPTVSMHTRSVIAICRGAGVDRDRMQYPITLLPTQGRPLHRVARMISEQAADHVAVILDSKSALESTSEHMAGIRERDSLFWNAVDQIGKATLIIAHPNREDARRWGRADGRSAGAEISHDRTRMNWRGTWRDEQAVTGTSFRRYTLENTWFNDGPTQAPFGIGVTWAFGVNDQDPGTVYFTEVEPILRSHQTDEPETSDDLPEEAATEGDLRPAMREALEAWRAGARTPGALRKAVPGLSYEAAKQRIRRLNEWLERQAKAPAPTTQMTIDQPVEGA